MTERLRHLIALLAVAQNVVVGQPVPAPTKVVGAQGAWWILDDRGELRFFDGHCSKSAAPLISLLASERDHPEGC
jgi:hypothetical protein